MPDPLDLQSAPPRPAMTGPSALPGLVAVVGALAVSAGQWLHANGSGRSAAITLAAVGAGFFLGRRLGGERLGLLLAMVLAAMIAGCSFGAHFQLAIVLTVVGAWWALRYRDDPSPANALVAIAAFAALGWWVVQGGR